MRLSPFALAGTGNEGKRRSCAGVIDPTDGGDPIVAIATSHFRFDRVAEYHKRIAEDAQEAAARAGLAIDVFDADNTAAASTPCLQPRDGALDRLRRVRDHLVRSDRVSKPILRAIRHDRSRER